MDVYQIETVNSFFLIQPGQLNQAVMELCEKVCEILWREKGIEKEQHLCVDQIERRNKELKKAGLEYKEKDEETKLAKNKVAALYNILVSYYSSSLFYWRQG